MHPNMMCSRAWGQTCRMPPCGLIRYHPCFKEVQLLQSLASPPLSSRWWWDVFALLFMLQCCRAASHALTCKHLRSQGGCWRQWAAVSCTFVTCWMLHARQLLGNKQCLARWHVLRTCWWQACIFFCQPTCCAKLCRCTCRRTLVCEFCRPSLRT